MRVSIREELRQVDELLDERLKANRDEKLSSTRNPRSPHGWRADSCATQVGQIRSALLVLLAACSFAAAVDRFLVGRETVIQVGLGVVLFAGGVIELLRSRAEPSRNAGQDPATQN